MERKDEVRREVIDEDFFPSPVFVNGEFLAAPAKALKRREELLEGWFKKQSIIFQNLDVGYVLSLDCICEEKENFNTSGNYICHRIDCFYN